MLKLQFKDSRQAPVWLADEKITIGQDERNSLVLLDEGVSLFHAEIRRDAGHYYLSDCASESGTLINSEKITSRYQIRPDDLLQIGPVTLQFIDPVKVAAQTDTSKSWFLQVIQGENEGKKYPLLGSMTFGRSSKCELCFNDAELSRRHCEFFFFQGLLEVKDLGSANGILLNRNKVYAATLQAGDQLQMGNVIFLVIGPKVELVQAEDEDATVFKPMVQLPRVNTSKAPVTKPLASQPVYTAANPQGTSTSMLVVAACSLLLVVAAVWAFTDLL
jgi:pSer/pThr/pTyr-binding forkhead associated (FHA) protein